MKIQAILSAALVASTQAFVPASTNNQIATSLRAEIGESGVAFENVAREWRCKVRLSR